jgi:hypothetical protein
MVNSFVLIKNKLITKIMSELPDELDYRYDLRPDPSLLLATVAYRYIPY